VIYFLDNDSEVSESAMAVGLDFLKSNPGAVIGGPAITRRQAGWLEKSIGLTMSLSIAGGPTSARHIAIGSRREVSGDELTLCNMMMSRKVFEGFSGLNKDLYPGEDPEFLKRLKSGGVRLVYDPALWISRSRRSTIGGFARQFFNYGAGRARHLFRSPRLRDAIFVLPSLLVAYLIAIVILPNSLPHWPVELLFIAIALEAIFKSEAPDRWSKASTAAPLACLMLCSYGVGFLAGMFGWRRIGEGDIRIERIELQGRST
jgi:hypothetical protein